MRFDRSPGHPYLLCGRDALARRPASWGIAARLALVAALVVGACSDSPGFIFGDPDATLLDADGGGDAADALPDGDVRDSDTADAGDTAADEPDADDPDVDVDVADAADSADADPPEDVDDTDAIDSADGPDDADDADTVDAPPASVCGNGALEPGEACDDGNRFDDDLCTNACQPGRCGDRIIQRVNGETCDDGNDDAGDGCDACLLEERGGPGVFAIVGHDFGLTADPVPAEFIANVFERAAPSDGRLVVAEFVEFSDRHEWSSLEHTWDAVEPILDDRGVTVERVPVEQHDAIYAILPEVDALFVPVPDTDEERVRMRGIGAEWARALRGFVDRGGVVVVTDAGSFYANAFTSAVGIIQPTSAYELVSVETEILVVGSHPLAPDAVSYLPPRRSIAFDFRFTDRVGVPIAIRSSNDFQVLSLFESTCGDGVVDEGEECDDGNRAPNDGCNEQCQATGCGNGIVEAAEVCDDGNRYDLDGCRADCSGPAACGDGLVQELLGEQCDDGDRNDDGAPDACRTDCTPPRCGDGVVDAGEACDDGNDVDDDGCSTVCRTPGCPDGVLQVGEECDDGNIVDDDSCSNTCRVGFCGDGIRQRGRGEECDDGGTINADGCDAECLRESDAGFVVWLGYAFDEPSPAAERVLANALRLGDWTPPLRIVAFDEAAEREEQVHQVEAALERAMRASGTEYELVRIHFVEQIDDALVGADALLVHAFERTVPPILFDTIRETAEDFTRAGGVAIAIGGNRSSYPALQASWGIEADTVVPDREAGSSAVRGAELGAGVPNHAIPSTAHAFAPYYPGRVRFGVVDRDDQPLAISRQVTCGDGIRQIWAGEACDDGNDDETDGCYRSCGTTVCGNGILETGEACDDGNRNNSDACGNNCRGNFCGDGRVNNGEQCDDGNVIANDGCELDCTRTTNVPACGTYVGSSLGRIRSGSTDRAPNSYDAGCGNSASVGDVLTWWRAPTAGTYRFDVASPDGSETTVSLWEPGGACTDPAPVACNHNASSTSSSLTRAMAADELLGIVVDAYADPSVFCWFDWCAEGDFTLTVTRL